MPSSIQEFNQTLSPQDQAICELLMTEINAALPDLESKIWHAHPVWFDDGNPIVGYSKLKDSVRLMFWSGQSFEGTDLAPTGKFKAAEIRYTNVDQIDLPQLRHWLEQSLKIQWDYKHIVKRKGQLRKLKGE